VKAVHIEMNDLAQADENSRKSTSLVRRVQRLKRLRISGDCGEWCLVYDAGLSLPSIGEGNTP
ncbi:MAG TPA: hypothetical protein VIT23_11735, partial [Terrimicrobiaceae bacterium]